jgi:hypothetical protein
MKFRDNLHHANDVAVEVLKFFSRYPVFLKSFASRLLRLIARDEAAATLKRVT